jgi:hypothetical protein
MIPKAKLPHLFFVFLFLFPSLFPKTVPDGWDWVGNGVEFKVFHLPDPNNVFVARMDRQNPNVTLESSIALGRLSSGRETVRSMAARYDQAINYWGQRWGARNKVVVAINGYYFDPETGLPQRGQVHSGWYAKRFDDYENGSGFAWDLERNAFIGGCVYHRPAKQFITVVKTGATQKFSGINVPRGDDELVIYTPQYDAFTPTDNSGVEVVVELTRPSMILPAPAMARGYIREIRDKQGGSAIAFDQVVLSASGFARAKLLNYGIQVGDEIGISQEITHYDSDCVTPDSTSWTKVYASIGGIFNFLKDGKIQSFDDPGAIFRYPRTAIAFNDRYIYFIVVDGREPGVSLGMTIRELALFARDSLGATWGVAQDGGGSSTMVINGEVVNNTYCNFTDCSKTQVQADELDPSDFPQAAIDLESSAMLEALVANGMMMVDALPMEKAAYLNPGDTLAVLSDTALRLGPGTNYARLATIPTGTPLEILPDMNSLNGVLAKGASWWKVRYGSQEGWAAVWALNDKSRFLPFVFQ